MTKQEKELQLQRNNDFVNCCDRYKKLNLEIKDLKESLELVTTHLKWLLQQYNGVLSDSLAQNVAYSVEGYTATLAFETRKILDTKALKNAGLYDKYTKENTTSKLTVVTPIND